MLIIWSSSYAARTRMGDPEQDAFLAGCRIMAIFLRAALRRCADNRIVAGDGGPKSGGRPKT